MRAPAFTLLILSLILGDGTAAAQPQPQAQPRSPAPMMGPPAPIVKDQKCEQPEPGSDEVVVCGENLEDSPYRIPRELRHRETHEDSSASWSARVQDEQSLARYSNQNVGASGMSQRSRQVDCEWRVARQQAEGRRPDCNRQIRGLNPFKP